MNVKSIGINSYSYEPIKIYNYGESDNGDPSYDVYIGHYTSISENLKIVINDGNHWYNTGTTFPFKGFGIPSKSHGDVIIGSDVWIGRDVTIMSGIKIGDGAVIAASSHVVKNVEPYTVCGGNPAKFIKHRFDKELIDKFLELKWWNYPPHIVDSIVPYLKQEPTADIIEHIKNMLELKK